MGVWQVYDDVSIDALGTEPAAGASYVFVPLVACKVGSYANPIIVILGDGTNQSYQDLDL